MVPKNPKPQKKVIRTMSFLDDFLDSIFEIFDPSTAKKRKKKKKQKKQKAKSKRKQKSSKSQKTSKTSASDSAGASLEEKILGLLADGEKSASELSSLLGVDKPSINRILYQNIDDLFTKHGETPPYWSLADGFKLEEVDLDEVSSISFPKPYDWQAKASKAWRDAGEQGVIEAVTGTGKTFLGAIALGKVIEEGGKGVVLVPTRELQDQWVAELEKCGFPTVGRLGNGHHQTLGECTVLVAVAASACKYDLGLPRGTKGVLVADEVHRYASETWQEALKPAFESRLGLTATFERQDGTHEDTLLPYFKNIVFQYDYPQAIKQGIIAEFKLATIGVSFSKAEREHYEKCSEEVSKAVRHLRNHHGAPNPYAGGKSFGEFMKFITQLKRGERREGIAAGKFLKHFTERKRLLAETDTKYEALKKLSSSIKASNGTIAFTATIESAKIAADILLGKKISCGLHHSKINKENRRLVLKQFKDRDLNAIIAPKTLDEGIDVPEADLGIIIAASREKRQMIQRMGRVLRRKKDQRLAKFAILYVKDTSEDPKNGAHGAFLETILPVASEHKDFGPRASAKSISDFLK